MSKYNLIITSSVYFMPGVVSRMRSWFVFLALLPLANFASGRTIFNMIEFDDGLDITRAYKKCMAVCKRKCRDVDCADDDTMSSLCMNGGSTENGFRVEACRHILPKRWHADVLPVEQKEPFRPKEIWELFQK